MTCSVVDCPWGGHCHISVCVERFEIIETKETHWKKYAPKGCVAITRWGRVIYDPTEMNKYKPEDFEYVPDVRLILDRRRKK